MDSRPGRDVTTQDWPQAIAVPEQLMAGHPSSPTPTFTFSPGKPRLGKNQTQETQGRKESGGGGVLSTLPNSCVVWGRCWHQAGLSSSRGVRLLDLEC